MAPERARQASIPQALSEVMGDFADLFQKELRLARAELTANVSTKLRGGVWLTLAALFGLLSLSLLLGAAVAWITTLDVSLHVAFLIMAVALALLAVLFYLVGRKDAGAELSPSRTIRQIHADIQTTKEQLR
jgi:uncharacterized membrane protein YozB (DUF420 family)